MKKFLSILIAAAMIISMLPTVAFATGTEAEAPLEYLLNTSVIKESVVVGGTTLKNGTIAVYGKSGVDSLQKSVTLFDQLESTTQPWLLVNQFRNSGGYINGVRLQWAATQANIEAGTAWLVFKILIPAGKYKFDISAADYLYGAGVDVYVIPGSGKNNSDSFTETNFAGHIDTYAYGINAPAAADDFEAKPVGTVNIDAEEDFYYVALKLTKSGYADNKSQEHIFVDKFIFTPLSTSPVTLDSTDLSFSLDAPEGVEIKVNDKAHTDDYVYDFTRGTEVTVTAGDAPQGYRFKAWVQGTADNGIWKSSNPEYTFDIMSHTYLTAVYELIPKAEYVVEYYNENGKLLDTIAAEETTPVLPDVNPSLTGYTFNMWTLDGKTKFDESVTLTEKLTRAVAKYNAKAIPKNDTVTVNDEPASAVFGTELPLSDATATHWLRDGRVVAYGKEYTHFVWDGTKIISSSAAVVKNPIVIIENTLVDGANMIEYDAGDKSIVEVGILYGSATVEIGSCRFKATSQWNKTHGQFTASRNSTEEYARGYLIYEDGDVYKIIYTDPVSAK